MRSYFKAYRKVTTSQYGQSCALVSTPPDNGWELVYVDMPTKFALMSRFNALGSNASVVMTDHFGHSLTRTGFFMVNQMFPSIAYRYHPKN